MSTGFFAYSSNPKTSGESIEEAIVKINSQNITEITSWKNLTVSGRLIIDEVVSAINSASYFCADLTGMSDNVLFELGYAIAKDKPIFLILDTSHTESRNRFRELDLLTTFGYSSYTNSNNIHKDFFEEKVFERKRGFLTDLKRSFRATEDKQSLLFLKNQIDTNYNQTIVQKIEKEFRLSYFLDDSRETPIKSFTWYLEHIHNVPAVLVEFSPTDREGYILNNLKASLVAGLALGFDKKLLMISVEPYKVPIDYREYLVKYETKSGCVNAIDPFLKYIQERAIQFLSKRSISQKSHKERTDLQNIDFGDYIAEDEREMLENYYLEIFETKKIAKNNFNIIIGRKGSGKTAALFSLNSTLKEDSRNHVCLIKPVSFEIDSLLFLIESLPENYEKSYLVEGAWKFLIYTEIARSIYEYLKTRHPSSYTGSEVQFLNYIDANSKLFFPDLSERLEKELTRILEVGTYGKVSEFKVRVSEAIHENSLATVRELIGQLFSREKRIVVLIDNLDKSWSKGPEIDAQTRWILGLLEATETIVRDLSRVGEKIYFNLTIFLRSDIFRYIQENSTEPDKLTYTNLKWNDEEILFRIIEKRFVELNQKAVEKEDLWEKFIVNNVEDENVKNYILDRIIPRPRDIIFFFKKAQESAVLKGHNIIEEADLNSAYKEYSSWFFLSLLVEGEVATEKLREFLYQLFGRPNILDKETIYIYMAEAGIKNDSEEYLKVFIEQLSGLSILGREVKKDDFRFEYDFDSKDKIRIMADRLGNSRFKIHNALVPYLECELE